MRAIGSSCVDPYSAMAGAAAALYGPLHGGANEEVLKMLSRIDQTRNIPEFIQRVKNGEGKLMGFGIAFTNIMILARESLNALRTKCSS